VTRSIPAMGTIVTIQVVDDGRDRHEEVDERVERAFDWIRQVEATCTRFDPDSEAMRLGSQAGTPVVASDILFEAVQFAVAVAEATGGAFDPTVGQILQHRGFNRHYATGEVVAERLDAPGATYRDIHLDPAGRAITVARPLILDLGAVAKGLAVDLAARELAPLKNFAIDAGGDLYLAGHGVGGRPWTVGIRHPREDGRLLRQLMVSDLAVCTSGDYERAAPDPQDGHHLIDARGGACAAAASSATVLAPTAMVADALATAAFVLGPSEGLPFLEAQGVEGLIVSASLEQHVTRRFETTFGGQTVLRDAEGPADHPAGDPHGAGRLERRRAAGRSRTA